MYEFYRLNTFSRVLKKILPIFLSIPTFDIGMPVVRLMFCFIFVIPNARFHEKLRPGMGDFFFIAILFQ